ncbi:MAG: glycosyltransferase [Angustibacter sp.]
MRVLAWHVHGSWSTAFVQGDHEYVVPVLPNRGPDGRGRARTWDWPASVLERPPDRLMDEPPDVVVLQRHHEAQLLREWTGLRAGVDVPAVFVEHDTPRGDVDGWRHPLADQPLIPVVHVTHFNRAMWDVGRTASRVVEHGVVDPGYRWTGELPRLGMAVNEPVRRWRVAGMDLAARLARQVPVDVHGMQIGALVEREPAFSGGWHAEDLPQDALHDQLARRRAYLHAYRWTSLGLSLIEAMMLGCPVLVLAATAAPQAVPPGAGVVTADVDQLAATARELLHDRDAARAYGQVARAHALRHFGIERFLADWDLLLKEVA